MQDWSAFTRNFTFGSDSALLFSVCNVFVCVSCFLFLKHDQFYQGWTAEHSAEHTKKSFTGFWLFGRFAGHCSWRSRSAGQTLQDTQTGKRAGGLVKLRQLRLRTPLPSIHLANLRSLPNKTDEQLLLSQTNKDFSNSAALCFTETWLNDAIQDSVLHLPNFQLIGADHNAESMGKSRGGGTCLYINERWCTDVTVLKKMWCSDLETLFINCKPFYSPREFCSFILVSVYIPP